MTKLKRCPFCGDVITCSADPDDETYIRGYRSGFAGCSNDECPVNSNGDVFVTAATQKKATAAWNARPIEDELQSRITQLEQERDEWKQDAERLAKYQYEMSFGKFDITDSAQDKTVFICRHCHNYSETKETIAHAADCVFELHRKLVEKEAK